MLKALFTSKARIKLLTLFLLNPEKEYFVRELTRELDEQINSVRRELDNLKKIGLLRSRAKARRKFYTVNESHILYKDLKNIILKATQSTDTVIKKLKKLGDLKYMLLSGVFMNKEASVDLLLVGEVDSEALETYLDTLELDQAVRFTILTEEDFLYRVKCRDQFILDLIQDEDNLVGLNKLDF